MKIKHVLISFFFLYNDFKSSFLSRIYISLRWGGIEEFCLCGKEIECLWNIDTFPFRIFCLYYFLLFSTERFAAYSARNTHFRKFKLTQLPLQFQGNGKFLTADYLLIPVGRYNSYGKTCGIYTEGTNNTTTAIIVHCRRG